MSDDSHSDVDKLINPIVAGFGVLAVIAAFAVTAMLTAGHPKYDRTDLKTVENLKIEQRRAMEAAPQWVDKDKGIAAIPVSDAEKLVVQEIAKNPELATVGSAAPPDAGAPPAEEAPEPKKAGKMGAKKAEKKPVKAAKTASK